MEARLQGNGRLSRGHFEPGHMPSTELFRHATEAKTWQVAAGSLINPELEEDA